MDLFKAIFEDSESDDETSENENKELNKHDVDIEPKTFLLEDVIPKQTLQPTNSVAEKHSKVASGVFGNIDLDNVNKRPSSMIQSTDTKKLPSIAVQVPKTAVQEVNGKSRPICDYYGPSLPPPAINASTSETLQLQLVTDSDSYTWEEAKPKKHKHKHKKTLVNERGYYFCCCNGR